MRGVVAQGLLCACAFIVPVSAADPLPVAPGESWTYFRGTVEPPSDWFDFFSVWKAKNGLA